MNTERPLESQNVGLIPDGNRRWAKHNHLEYGDAYCIAMNKLAASIDTLLDRGSSTVVIFALSRDNLERRRDDLEAVCDAEEMFLTELLPSVKATHGAAVFHAGLVELLRKTYQRCLAGVCDADVDRRSAAPSIFVCAAYDPFDEIVASRDRFGRTDQETLAALWVPKSIDLLIRTGGDQRLSGFLPLQCKYAEFFFEPYFFPDITTARINDVVRRFTNRERRLGKDGVAPSAPSQSG